MANLGMPVGCYEGLCCYQAGQAVIHCWRPVMFRNLLKVGRAHHRVFVDALAALLARQPLAEQRIYVCETCGNTVMGEAPEACGVCGSPAGALREAQ